MGDCIKNTAIFKKLGFDSCNQWVLYDESFQKFFTRFADSITDENILNDSEILEETELKKRSQYYQGNELNSRLLTLNKEYSAILDYTDEDIENLELEIEQLEKAEVMYIDLKKDMEKTKSAISREICDLEVSINELENGEKTVLTDCSEKAVELQELQRANKQSSLEINECFTKSQTPPLFLHQLPLDQYYLKCDSFLQYLTLYMRENFKIQNYLELGEDLGIPSEISEKLENIRNRLYQSQKKFIKARIEAFAIRRMTDDLNVSRMLITSVGQLKKETHDLEVINKHNAIIYETLMNDLKMHLKQIAGQQIELILYENSKQKFERAIVRMENVKSLSKIVSDALSNAELVWILMQLDLERAKNKFDYTEQLNQESQRIMKRVDEMRQLQICSPNSRSDLLIGKISEILSKQSNTNRNHSTKTCLYEYEKFCRLSNYIFKGIPSKKLYIQVSNILNDLNHIESVLLAYIYDGPVKRPMFENSEFLVPIFNCKINQQRIEKNMRHLRAEFHENIQEKMNSDRLWRFGQLLWIWFLTEPKKVLSAIEEVRRSASKIPTVGIKTFGGIKRN